jgi:hypothetical protein
MRYAQVDGRQGRGNPPAFYTHRVQEEVFIDGLHTEDGGHFFQGGCVFPIEAEDEPAEGEDWFFKFTVFIVAVFMACLAGAAIAFLNAPKG